MARYHIGVVPVRALVFLVVNMNIARLCDHGLELLLVLMLENSKCVPGYARLVAASAVVVVLVLCCVVPWLFVVVVVVVLCCAVVCHCCCVVVATKRDSRNILPLALFRHRPLDGTVDIG